MIIENLIMMAACIIVYFEIRNFEIFMVVLWTSDQY